MPRLQFWFELASTYSYLTAMRIDALAASAGAEVEWRPFLLGPIFKRQGWSTSPFNVYPAKGRYMVRDMARIAAARGLPFQMPQTFPAASLLATRVALVAEPEGWMPAFVKAAYTAEFGRGADIGSETVVAELIAQCGNDAPAILAAAASQPIKDALRRRSEEAAALGIFGAPSFVTGDGELFWGDDRLEQAIAWAAKLA